jgi:hypothetical protein
VSDRAAALRSLRSRTEGLPPPPALSPAPRAASGEDPVARVQGRRDESFAGRDPADRGEEASDTAAGPASWQALLADPVKACRDMANRRENMPARPLNVDLTPAAAAAFDEQCRALRVKKKDVVELLLRGWLEHQGKDLD